MCLLIYRWNPFAGGPSGGASCKLSCFRGRQRDPNPKDNSLVGKETSTCKGFHSTFAALFSY